jgi:GWxTD domain-containing protein
MSTAPRRGTALLAACLALLPVLAGAAGKKDWNSPDKDWYQGPVRYLMTTEEEKQYRALAAEEDRRRFVEDFWARRDPDPSTPVNEAELLFRSRVAEADQLFRDSPHPGWKTDRGKFYVLLGPPDEIQQGTGFTRGAKEFPYLVWIYHEPRVPGMDRDTEMRFVRLESTEFELTDRLAFNRLEQLFGTPKLLAIQAVAAQVPPEPQKLLDTIAASQPSIDAKRFRTHYDFFLAEDGSTSVLVTLGVARSDPPIDWAIYARLSNASGAYDLARPDSFRTSEEARDVDGFRLYQGRISVPAGTYALFIGVRNPATGELFSLGERVPVPDFRDQTFKLSGITLAARLGDGTSVAGDPPFLVGRLLVIPKMEPVYKRGSEMAYYFQVYHAGKDPGSGEARLDLTYRFLVAEKVQKTGELSYSQLGKPLSFQDQSGLVHGYSFPLTGWPAGDFKLQVSAHDRVTGRQSDTEVRFSVR